MAFSVFPLSAKPITARQTELMRKRVARVSSQYLDFANVTEGAVGLQITPIYPTSSQLGDSLPPPSFSAQLLELGLKHNVEGLIQKANEQLSYDGAEPQSARTLAARQYERVQDNFAGNDIHMVTRTY